MSPISPASRSHKTHVCRRSRPLLLTGCTLAGSRNVLPIKRSVATARATASSMGAVLSSTSKASVNKGEPSSSCWSKVHTVSKAGTMPTKKGSSLPKSVVFNTCAEAHAISPKPSRAAVKPASVWLRPNMILPKHAVKITSTTTFGMSKGWRSFEQQRQHLQHGHVLQQQHDHTMMTKTAPIRADVRGKIHPGLNTDSASAPANSSVSSDSFKAFSIRFSPPTASTKAYLAFSICSLDISGKSVQN
mmetsp:Transcript_38109/g.115211  ORF Transcript_38109/g.115211 Transcript_38109/m.115211 type:complete len:246 (+) Transcript_38109:997-1734(+)